MVKDLGFPEGDSCFLLPEVRGTGEWLKSWWVTALMEGFYPHPANT